MSAPHPIRSILAAATAALLAALVPAAHASTTEGTIVAVDSNQSNNWSGYNQGLVEKGAPFTSIGGTWTVPRATQHQRGQAESSSVWIGIGGGCPESTCTAPSETLIQEGTEQDVAKNGRAYYSAWWEIIPAPSVTIASFPVAPGDRVKASIVESPPGLWTLTMRNLTTGRSFTQSVPYASSHDTAEWIVETPLTFGTSGAGLASMPDLSRVRFDHATANGTRAGLASTDEMQLVDANSHPVATPSAPDGDRDGFAVCTYAARCPAQRA